jgi:cytochrome c-type biogenesis protein CcmH
MLFWTICAVLALVVVATIVGPMLRAPKDAAAAPDVAFYKAQLAEVDRDVARDVLAGDEAERAKTEIARRLIAANASAAGGTDRPAGRVVAAVAGLGMLVLAGGVYWSMGAPGYPDLPLQQRIANGDAARLNRPTQAQAEAAAPALEPVDVPAEYLENVAQLRQIVPTRPDDLQGWILLARNEASLRNFSAAAKAQARVVALKGDDATLGDQMVQLDMMVAAANGFISPEAEVLVRALLSQDPDNVPGRYYLGALYDQTDRPDIAFRLWRDIVENGPNDLFHVGFARDQIEETAFRAGVNYELPALRGPTLADVENAQNLSEEDQRVMIEGMVAGLADRLATQGGPATDWARLITAYGVLGEVETAQAIYVEAKGVFGASEEALGVLDAAAQAAGVAQ